MTQTETVKIEDQQLKQKYKIDDDNPPPPLYNTAVYTDLQSISKKIRRFHRDVAELKLEIPVEIKQEEAQKN